MLPLPLCAASLLVAEEQHGYIHVVNVRIIHVPNVENVVGIQMEQHIRRHGGFADAVRQVIHGGNHQIRLSITWVIKKWESAKVVSL